MSITLRPLSDINALISAADYSGLTYSRKYQLTCQVEAAALELDLVIPVLLAQAASRLEEQFVRALVIVPAAGAGTPQPAYGPSFVLPLVWQGTLASGQIFGGFVTPDDLAVTGMQLTLQQPEPNSSVEVVLVDNYDNPMTGWAWPSLDPGSRLQYSNFDGSKYLPNGTLLRAMITNYSPGSAGPIGAGLTLYVVARLY